MASLNFAQLSLPVGQAGQFGESGLIDGFGRLRVSNPVTLLDVTNQYGPDPLIFETSLTGTAASAHIPNESATQLSVASAGDFAMQQSRSYVRYQPSKSLLSFITFQCGEESPDPNVSFRAGVFDDQNGHFVQIGGGVVSMVRRSYKTGSVVDTVVPQSSWSEDALDGSGKSGITLDPSAAQILWFDQEWLGVGTVRMGFVIDGQLVHCHSFHHANVGNSVYNTTASLPMRWEIEATGAPASTRSVKAICGAIVSEGGADDERYLPFSASTGIVERSVGSVTEVPILSIRPKVLFNGVTNRTQVVLDSLEVFARSANIKYDLRYGGTIAGATWAKATPDSSAVEVDIAGSSITGGIALLEAFAPSGQGNQNTGGNFSILKSRLPIVVNRAATQQQTVSVVALSFSGNASVSAAINWRETR